MLKPDLSMKTSAPLRIFLRLFVQYSFHKSFIHTEFLSSGITVRFLVVKSMFLKISPM